MEELWILILVAFFAIISIDKAESVKLKLKTFDEIFGEGWWDKGEAEDLKTPAPTNFGQNVHHQIDRLNTQIGQIETDQNPPITESDHSGQIELNTTDQNPPLTESDHSGQIELNTTDQNPPLTESDHFGQIEPNNENIVEDKRKRKIINKFNSLKEELKQKGKFPRKERNQIEQKIAEHLKVCRSKIYKWKKEFGLNQRAFYEKEERKNLVAKFDQMKAELKRAGFKNSYHNQIDEAVAKELGISFMTIYRWKRKLGQSTPNHIYSDSEQKKLMKRYYKIKDQTPKIKDKDIAKMLKIGKDTLFRWKKQYKRQQFHPNSVDGHSVEENAAANVQEIEKTNSGSIN